METNVKPFLKWAGGKTQLLPQIIERLPTDFHKKRRYVEPFIGAGAVFFYLISNNCFDEYVINDINSKLINLYKVMRENCDELLGELRALKEQYMTLGEMEKKEQFYYEIRDEFNENESSCVRMGALFIFLNKTCFNGLYRENLKGNFNVPFGKHNSPSIYEETDIRLVSKLLGSKNNKGEYRVEILNTSFENLKEYIDENTFVYFDPPYRPVTAGGFNSYSKSSFNDDSQIKLRDFYLDCDKKGARLMQSNSDPRVLDKDDDFFDSLYKGFIVKRVSASRMINSKGSGRGAITELLITNYGEEERKMGVSYEKNAQTFDYLLSTLKDSIKGWEYFVNWDKVNTNVKDIEIQLNILNYLIGKENIEDEARYLISKHPEVISAIPILVACREKNFQIISSDEVDMFKSKNYLFHDNKSISSEQIDDIVEFMSETKVLEIFSNKTIKNVVDYVFGVEVGLDSNGRKNRSGHAMEDMVEKFVSKICKDTGYNYLKEATPSAIKSEWGYNVTVDKSARRFDFAINTGNKLYLIETNYYGGGGSKLKATAGEYKTLYDVIKEDGHEFIWITDGKGWLTANRPLEETFYHNKYIMNLTMLEQGLLNDILKG
ncbi:DpnII family type II restriction endonuclease [Clostridium sp. C8-1-8]|uniref:DpnII family type II restriction endonuclease n=1 Tax=Clostridium sp. C8-1-8 TaxID=2698831 RepID=UPI001FAC820C|nr:DpnII family type II restriction endonuclease [Clostridium sp. C8-1-8]